MEGAVRIDRRLTVILGTIIDYPYRMLWKWGMVFQHRFVVVDPGTVAKVFRADRPEWAVVKARDVAILGEFFSRTPEVKGLCD